MAVRLLPTCLCSAIVDALCLYDLVGGAASDTLRSAVQQGMRAVMVQRLFGHALESAVDSVSQRGLMSSQRAT